jgi:hypothetical protein
VERIPGSIPLPVPRSPVACSTSWANLRAHMAREPAFAIALDLRVACEQDLRVLAVLLAHDLLEALIERQ